MEGLVGGGGVSRGGGMEWKGAWGGKGRARRKLGAKEKG